MLTVYQRKSLNFRVHGLSLSSTDVSIFVALHLSLPPQHNVQSPIIHGQSKTTGSGENQERAVGPMARGVAFRGLVGLVYPNADDLTGCAEGGVQRNDKTRGRRCEDVGGDPPERGRNRREGTGGSDYEAAVSTLRTPASVVRKNDGRGKLYSPHKHPREGALTP